MSVIATSIPENMTAINLRSLRIRPNTSLITDIELVEVTAAFFGTQAKRDF